LEIKLKIKLLGPLMKRKWGGIYRKEFGDAMHMAVTLTETAVKEGTPVGVSGELRAGILGEVVNYLKGRIVATGLGAIYAKVVEKGRGPSSKPPPYDAIELWIRRTDAGKSLASAIGSTEKAARTLQWKIKKYGWKGGGGRNRKGGYEMFKKAEKKMKSKIKSLFQTAKTRIEKALSD
jgi:hypothetical protein